MPTKSIIQPKQQRSQQTQRKLLDALHLCLRDKFFEHITIKELAEHAGVSVGTFYRRFKDKESLLPLLYQDFGNHLDQWVDGLQQRDYGSLRDVLEIMATETCHFMASKRSVFRTLHLNSRLHAEILASDTQVDRRDIYQRLAAILLRFEADMTVTSPSSAADNVVFLLITSLLDKTLYPDLTPAIACDASAAQLADELPHILLPYLVTPQGQI